MSSPDAELDLLQRLLRALCESKALVRDLGVIGYTLVGSSAYLTAETDAGADVDVVLLATSPIEPEVALPRILQALEHSHDLLQDTAIWYVQAVACLLKVTRGAESIDLLFAPRCGSPPPPPPGEEAPTTVLQAMDPNQALSLLPDDVPSRTRDCVMLTQCVMNALKRPVGTTTAFTSENVMYLRRWAKGRHVYGTRFGFPGGSAWMVMLLVYCRWYDRVLLDPNRTGCRVSDVLWHFLLTVALWPWPMPFTTENMDSLLRCSRSGMPVGPAAAVPLVMVGGRVLEGSVGRRMATSFVVPLPCGTIWNMTQAVQWPQHLCVLREAWAMGIHRPPATPEGWVFEDFRQEVFRIGSQHQWPIHLVVWIPDKAPPNWKALVASRLVSTLGPQLDAGGFLARPLCTDHPFIFLLWPQDCTWSRWSPTEYLLPLRSRLREVLFHMLYEAYELLWPGGYSELASLPAQPPLEDLLPDLRVFRHPPEPPAAAASS